MLSDILINASIPQSQYVFVFDALMESIMCGDNTIGAPTNVAKERLEELAKVNPATHKSGYESQFKVSFTLIKHSEI